MATKDEKQIETGKNALRRSYHESMRSFAREILQDAVNSNYEDYDEAEEYIQEQIDQTADGTSWVIYTGNALDVLVASDNWLAIDDVGIESNELTTILTQAAYFAVRQDIAEYVEAFKDEYWTDTEGNPKPAPKAARAVKAKLLR